MCWIQQVFDNYRGTLLQLTVGDKGSYLYGAFGAPTAHEDDLFRAANTALTLLRPPLELAFIGPVQIGLSQGTMRTGAYGSAARRTYGVLGDEVNFAARLMQAAPPGEIWVNGALHKALQTAFVVEELPLMQFKGKSALHAVGRLVRPRATQTRAEAFYAGPLIGRETELSALFNFVNPIFQGQCAGLLALHAEAGVGKTRLLYEFRRQLQRAHPHQWFTCPAEGILRQSLAPFKYFLRQYFSQSQTETAATNQARFDERLDALLQTLATPATEAVRQELHRTRSFLAAMVDLFQPGALYDQSEPKLRFENTLAAFTSLMRAESLRSPVIVQIEDAHHLDADSHAQLRALARNAEGYAIALIFAARYTDDGHRLTLTLEADIPTHDLDLRALTLEGTRALAEETLGGPLSPMLAQFAYEKTGGNPFFVEQMMLDLRERGVLTRGPEGWDSSAHTLAEVPASINAVLVARLDRLIPQVRVVVQTATALGQEFELRLLAQMLQDDAQLTDKVRRAETEAIWSALNVLRYIFRHALLRDTAYNMMLQARQKELHQLAGEAIETVYAADLPPHAADLAYHFGKAEDTARERRYARLAGDRAAERFANAEAVAYFTRALALTPSDQSAEQFALLLAREQVYDLQGARVAQARDLDALTQLAEQLDDDVRRAEVALRRANYGEMTGDYPTSIEQAQRAVALAAPHAAQALAATGHLRAGRALWQKAQYDDARVELTRAVALAREAQLSTIEGDGLRNLGVVTLRQGQPAQAKTYYEAAYAIFQTTKDRRGESNALNNLGGLAYRQGEYAEARRYYEAAKQAFHEVGDRRGESGVLNNLGVIALEQNDYHGSQVYHQHALQLCREVGNRYGESLALGNLAEFALFVGDHDGVQHYAEQALRLCQTIGNREGEIYALVYLGLRSHRLGDDEGALAYSQQAQALAQQLGLKHLLGFALTHLGHAYTSLGQWAAARAAYAPAYQLRNELKEKNLALETLAGLGRVALAANDPIAQRQTLELLWPALQDNPLAGAEEPVRVYVTVYDLLSALDDARAATFWPTMQAYAQQRLAQLGEPTLQQHFRALPAVRRLLSQAAPP
jgi:predicted ATPase